MKPVAMKAAPLPRLDISVNCVVGVDPGDTKSAWVRYDPRTHVIVGLGELANDDLLALIARLPSCRDVLAVEWIHYQAKKVGAEIFDTCRWVGIFEHEARRHGVHCERITRLQARSHVADQYAGDPEVKRALIELHGGKDAAVGTKKAPGPLFGASSHVLAALAVARTFADTRLPQIPFHS